MRLISSVFALVLAATIAGADEEMYLLPEPGSDRVPAYLIQVPDSIDGVLIANAAASELVHVANEASSYTVLSRRYMSVGTRGVGKQRSGDRKTPLGIYFMTEELDTHRMDPKYGAAAFVLDYPNVWDRRQARTGYGIWLHGVHPATPMRPPLDTDGCLALPNAELLSLKPSLVMHSMPVIVARRMEWSSPEQIAELRDALADAVEGWRMSLEVGDLHAHLAHYHNDFAARGMSKPEWARFRAASLSTNPVTDVDVDELMLLRDPEDPTLYLARFRQTLVSDSGSVSLTKRLYWRQEDSGFLVIAEDAG